MNSFLGQEDFCQAFHQTPCDHPTPTSSTLKSSVPEAGYFAGDKNSGEGSTGFTDDIGLMSCTESLGFESSDEISTLDDLGTFSNYNSCKTNSRNEDSSSSSPPSSSSSSSCSSLSSSFYFYNNSRMNKWTSKRTEKKNFPAPLTSLRENGRRDFVLRPVRENGRLEIIGVMIERPEILCASRKNGRLTLHLVKSHPVEDDYEEETGEEREKTESEEEVDEETGEEETGEEREWKIAAAGLRRCYQREMHVWGQQRQRCVTTT